MPLVATALSQFGTCDTLDRLAGTNSWLAALVINRNSLNESVTDQALDGIFAYVGREEREVRANPLETVGGLLDRFSS